MKVVKNEGAGGVARLILAQFAHITPNSKVFSKYLSAVCKKERVDAVILGEYVANRFFKEYHLESRESRELRDSSDSHNSHSDSRDSKKARDSIDKSALKREFSASVKYFSALAKKHKTTIVAPLIECEGEKIYKSILIAEPTKARFYRATRLMEFSHWDERAFFDNDLKAREPLVFSVGGLKTSAIFGWEAHFDEILVKLKKKGVDLLLVPTANTFGSNLRWQRLLQTRSFLNSCYLVRVNRVGEYVESGIRWQFYGESFVSLPDGNLGDMLGEKEGILVSEVNAESLQTTKQSWRFR